MAISGITTDVLGAWQSKNPDNVAQFSPGQRCAGDFGAMFLYGQAFAALAAGDFVVLNNNYVASQLTNVNGLRGQKVAGTRYAMASGQWGWFQIEGQFAGRSAGPIAAGAQLNTTATGGAIDDDATVGSKRIDNICTIFAIAGAVTTAEFQLSQPVVGATL